VSPSLGSEEVVAADHGAFARAIHGQCVEQTDQGKDAVYLATLSADDREPTVLALESPERLDEHVHSSRVNKRDLGQIHDDRTRFALESRQQNLAQQRRSPKIDFPAGSEHRYVVVMLVGASQDDRQPTGDGPRGANARLGGYRELCSLRSWAGPEAIGDLFLNLVHGQHWLRTKSGRK
jgi:hypothetical protein